MRRGEKRTQDGTAGTESRMRRRGGRSKMLEKEEVGTGRNPGGSGVTEIKGIVRSQSGWVLEGQGPEA